MLHISCHGVKDTDGQLYFAASNTRRGLLASTTVPATFLREQMDRCRAGTIVLLLDCCYSGAIVPGIRGDCDLHLGERLRAGAPGRGRVVITATNAVQYAREAEVSASDGVSGGFTASLIHGLRTGEADLDHDGAVSVEELFEYLAQKVREFNPDQDPRKWEFDVHGPIWVAKAPLGLMSPHLGAGTHSS